LFRAALAAHLAFFAGFGVFDDALAASQQSKANLFDELFIARTASLVYVQLADLRQADPGLPFYFRSITQLGSLWKKARC
jgi:hypothetical protein